MACGVLAQDGRWIAPARKADFLFEVRALSQVYRGKFMTALAVARRDGVINDDPQDEPAAWAQRQRQLYRHNWVVYAKTPLGGSTQVLEYLSRYTHRTAIGNQRIRHYGALASACKGEKLARARQALAMPAPNPPALESATHFLRRVSSIEAAQCPHCKVGTLRVVQTLTGQGRLPAPVGQAPRASYRGPP